jgi:hypothetical protein
MVMFTELPAKGQDPPSMPLELEAKRERPATRLSGNGPPDG